uniref:O-fucosyltransferase family protein n=1 Tax=Kalanchoe fedtschenkoi TaxID=63787 RepID=A0A7N0RIC4_KALFE
MGFDCRQLVAGFLTITMFVMLGNMIKRDHFDSVHVRLSETSDGFTDSVKSLDKSIAKLDQNWKEETEELKPCWTKPDLDDVEESEGYVTFSLTKGPVYHVSQIADAVVVARSLGATLVLPDIRGSKESERRTFGEIYDVTKFIKSLGGVVRVVKSLPDDIRKIAAVQVPNRVTQDYVMEHVEPVYRKKGSIRLSTHFHSVNMKKSDTKGNSDSVACLGMFGTLELQPAVQEVVDSMVERLRTLSRKSDGRFIAIDLRVDVLESKGCQENEGGEAKSCYDGMEIADFLQKTGFDRSSTIYVTQTVWHSSLDPLKEFFPKTYTKEGIMPADKKLKFLSENSVEFQEAIDFYICSESDVFVPAISGLFYANVAGKRIAAGRTRILVPATIPGKSAPADEFLSHYITEKNHFAYSCFC